jgi:ATP-dependent exoDNAse (exonuclease V) beta subunit
VSAIVDREDLDWTEKVRKISNLIGIANTSTLVSELESNPITGGMFAVEEEDEEAIETASASADVEMLTLVGSKGLSSKHVVVIGCDNVNFNYISIMTFFVAMTRGRESLHLITSLQSRGCERAHNYLSQIPEEYCQFLTYKKTGHTLTDVRSRRNWDLQISNWIPVRR